MSWRRVQAFWINVKRLLRAGNHDFCPGVNKYVYWLKRPIGWLLTAAFASVLVGLSIGPQGWVVLAVVSAVIGLGVLWPAVQMWGCVARIVVQQSRGMEGQPIRVTLQITNRLPFPLWGLMIGQQFLEQGRPDSPGASDQAMAALARVPAWSLTEFHWEHRPARRGRFPESGTQLATGFPFGVWQSSRWIDFEQTCLVWPAVPRITDPLTVHHLQTRGERTFENRAGQEGDFLGLRAYRLGDPLRKIHWPQSVRSGNLVVRESEMAVCKQVTLLVDLSDLLGLADPNGSERQVAGSGSWVELAAERRLRVALAVTESLWAAGFNVRLQLGFQVWETSGERRQVQTLMDQLAVWSWPDFFARWTAVRTINLRPDFVVGDWQTWHQAAEAVRLSEPAQGMILVHADTVVGQETLQLLDCCSPKAGVKCWQTLGRSTARSAVRAPRDEPLAQEPYPPVDRVEGLPGVLDQEGNRR